jgi:predicted acyl esterase
MPGMSSSNFPRFEGNLNTGEEQTSGKRLNKVTNVIYHDKAHPCPLVFSLALILPPVL